MRRGNICITGVTEEPGSSSPTVVSKLLKEVLHLDREVLIQRSQRSLTQRRPRDKPRVIIAKLHNEGDALDILRKARDRGGQLNYKGNPITIFPDRQSLGSVYTRQEDASGETWGPLRPAVSGQAPHHQQPR